MKEYGDNFVATNDIKNLRKVDYYNKMRSQGWGYFANENDKLNGIANDTSVFKDLYELGTKTDDKRVHELINYLNNLFIDSLKTRLKAIEEIEKLHDILKSDKNFPIKKFNLKRMKKDLSEEEFSSISANNEYVVETYKNSQKIEEDFRNFRNTLIKNGWQKEDEELITFMYTIMRDTVKNDVSISKTFLDNMKEKLMDTVLPPFNYYDKRNELLREFVEEMDRFIPLEYSHERKQFLSLVKEKYKQSGAVELDEEQKQKYAQKSEHERQTFNNLKEHFVTIKDEIKTDEKSKDFDPVSDTKQKLAKESNTDEASIIESLKNEATEMYNTIKAVDFNMFGLGSDKFNDMLRNLKGLKDYAKNELKVDKTGIIDAVKIAKYYDLQKKCIGFVEAYIEKKKEDLNEEGRKESFRRQWHEQPRISASIDVLEKLNTSYARGKNAVIMNMREYGRKILEKQMADEEKARNKKEISAEDYTYSVCKSLEMIHRLRGKRWMPGGLGREESLSDFVKRVQNDAKPIEKDYVIENIIKDDICPYKDVWKGEFKKSVGEDFNIDDLTNGKYKEIQIENAGIKNEHLKTKYLSLNENLAKQYGMKNHNVDKDIKNAKDKAFNERLDMLSAEQKTKNAKKTLAKLEAELKDKDVGAAPRIHK